ncbi:MAG: sulfotransferase [Pseudomonadota bacterium]
MTYPNLIIAGVQKAGTTWLHQVLSESEYIYGSEPKELNVFGHADYEKRLRTYGSCFEENTKPSATYYLESTPHYFHAPTILGDVANDIRQTLPDVRIIVVLRNPIDRYRSAYVHHIQKKRLEYVPEITSLTDDQIMLSTGLYGKILRHWQDVFPDMLVYSYDALFRDPKEFVERIFLDLKSEPGFDLSDLPKPNHTAEQKREAGGWSQTPVLSKALHIKLADFYRSDVAGLQDLVDFDVLSWLNPPS